MSPKPKRTESTETEATETGEIAVGNSARDEQIRFRAFEIYLERGEQQGHGLDDWLQAERELESGLFRREQAG
jgi:hypothetical protein